MCLSIRLYMPVCMSQKQLKTHAYGCTNNMHVHTYTSCMCMCMCIRVYQ